MDFINGCTTNVHVLDDFAATPYTHYKHTAPHTDVTQRTEDAQQAVAELRESRALCTLVGQDIWLFAHGEHGPGGKYTIAQEGVVEGRTDVIRLLLDAIESALSYSLAQEGQLTHIGQWTWLHCNHVAHREDESLVVALRVKEAPNGALYFLPEVTPTSWTPIDKASGSFDDEILLAPRGRSALAAAEETQSLVADALWKSNVLQALQMEGISLPTDAGWTDIEFVENGVKHTCIWPSQLCLVRQSTQPPEPRDLAEWQIWLDNGKDRVYRNPLAVAEEWFRGSAEQKRRAAEEAGRQAVHIDANLTSNTATAHDVNVITSPPFMQRTVDHQAAMSGIYPTPPDGLAHQGQTQTGATTGLSAATPSVVQPGDAVIATEILDDAPDQTEDPLGLDGYAMDEVEEDLFGDVGGEMFEENEVGDADFDYFDEPDDVPAVDGMSGGDLQMTDEHVPGVGFVGDTKYVPESSEADNVDNPHGQNLDVELLSSQPSAVVSTNRITNLGCGEKARDTEKRALSPFGIRERLLPPPVPASVAHGDGVARSLRRSSSFAPIVFRDGIDLGAKYAGMDITSDQDARNSRIEPSIALPPSGRCKDSDDDSDEAGSSEREYDVVELPPRLPWESTRKRKRSCAAVDISLTGQEGACADDNGSFFGENGDNEQIRSLQTTLLDQIMDSTSPVGVKALSKLLLKSRQKQWEEEQDEKREELPSLKDLYELGNGDLICIAQLISEQASTCLSAYSSPAIEGRRNDVSAKLLTTALRELFTSPLGSCDLSSLALTRDSSPPARNNLRAPVPQRPSLEIPDIFPLPAPYVRIRRNNDTWEMLPPALSFWEPNGLAAASGPKNVKARAVFPNNSDLRGAVQGFMGALGRTYEGCKLGTHSYEFDNDSESDAAAIVEEDGEPGSKAALMKGYAKTCDTLGKELAAWCTGPGVNWEGSIVIYILDPFAEEGARKYFCACFWMLFQSYLERLRAGRKGKGEDTVPDVVLQILPIDIVAGIDRIIVPDPGILASLAREVYDRCPAFPAADEEGEGAAAPSVLLAPPIPKRITFQLAADVPAESLLQDGRVLHLAVAMSADREWISCVWTNGQGRILTQESICLRGEAVGQVMRQAWQRTGDLVDRARIIWRVFVVLDEGVWHGSGLERVWRDVVTSGRIGGTTVCVTLVKVHAEMAVLVNGETAILDGTVGLATPAGTPAALPGGPGATTGTNSPNVGGSDGFGAPLTPAGSETTVSGTSAAMQVVENDPDAHLVDVEDETCGLLLKPQLSALIELDGMANGAIIRTGEESGGQRGLLGVSLYWTLQVKAQGAGAVEVGSLRQAEVTLREVLKMYRALSVLTRARGLHDGKGGLLPVHLAVACKGARALEGMLS